MGQRANKIPSDDIVMTNGTENDSKALVKRALLSHQYPEPELSCEIMKFFIVEKVYSNVFGTFSEMISFRNNRVSKRGE